MGTHSSTLAWKIPWTEEPGRLQAYRVRHDWATSLSTASESKDILDERRHMGDYSPCRAWRPLLSFLNGVQLLYNVAFVSAIIKMNQLYVHTHLPTSPPSPSRSSQSTKLSSLHRTSCVFYTWQWRRFKTKRWMWRLMPPEPSRICHLGSTTQLLQQTQGDSSWYLGLWSPGGHTGALLEWQMAESAMTPGTRHNRATRVPKRPRGLISIKSNAVVIRSQGPTAQESIWPPCSHSKDILVYVRRSGGAFQGLPWRPRG